MSGLSVSSRPVDENVHEDERVQYSSYGDERGNMSVDGGNDSRDVSSYDGDKRGDRSATDRIPSRDLEHNPE